MWVPARKSGSAAHAQTGEKCAGKTFDPAGAGWGCAGGGDGVDFHAESPCPIPFQNCLPERGRSVPRAWRVSFAQ